MYIPSMMCFMYVYLKTCKIDTYTHPKKPHLSVLRRIPYYSNDHTYIHN